MLGILNINAKGIKSSHNTMRVLSMGDVMKLWNASTKAAIKVHTHKGVAIYPNAPITKKADIQGSAPIACSLC
jgi:hypothetical protein